MPSESENLIPIILCTTLLATELDVCRASQILLGSAIRMAVLCHTKTETTNGYSPFGIQCVVKRARGFGRGSGKCIQNFI